MDFCFEQDSPQKICIDRPLETPELHPSNDFYGQASVLKKYAGLPEEYPLRTVLEHGLFQAEEMWDVDANADLPMIVSHTPFRETIHQNLCNKKTKVAGFGYLYAASVLEKEHSNQFDRIGTLIFPCHSTHVTTNRFDHVAFAEKLMALPERFHPLNVCIYWKNFLMDEHLEYQKRGIEIVSAGHMFDPMFLLRLADLCRRYRYATANEFGTHLFTSVSSGCKFFYTSSGAVERICPDSERKNDMVDVRSQRQIARSHELFSDREGDECTTEQKQYVNSVIGRDYMLPPDELRSVFRLAERMERTEKKKKWAKRKIAQIYRIGASVAKRLPWNTRKSA